MKAILRWLVSICLAGAIAAVIAHAQTATSSATVTWPPTCKLKTTALARMTCVDNHLEALDTRLRAVSAHEMADRARIVLLRARNTSLAACIVEMPVTRYTSSDNYTIPFHNDQLSNASTAPGYFNDYNWYGQAFSMYDQTHQGDNVGIWVLHDSCSTAVFGRPPPP